MNKLPPRPSHCTRRRMKPYIDSCECEWCTAINRGIVSQESYKDAEKRFFGSQLNPDGSVGPPLPSEAEECNHPALYESCSDEGQGATWYCPDCESVIDAPG
jgi:hypothetical protein